MYDCSLHSVHTRATDRIWENKTQHTQNYIIKVQNGGSNNNLESQ